MTSIARVVLKPGREKPVRQRHPWVFSGAVAAIDGAPAPGDVVDVVAAAGDWVGRGHISPASQIVVRVMTLDAAETLDDDAWRWRIERAVALRARLGLLARPDGACRLVHAESDGLPGLVVDRYADWLVIQLLTAGADARRDALVRLLAEAVGRHAAVRGVYERSTDEVRAKEGLAAEQGVRLGEAPPVPIAIAEPGVRGDVALDVDVVAGHKTGAYLDQAANRRAVAAWCGGADVLNAFSYTGGFALHALAAGAQRVTNVDSSAPALARAAATAAAAGWAVDDGSPDAADGAPIAPAGRMTNVEANVFGYLRACRAAGRTFDVVILDPPKFVHHAGQVEKAARAYKDLMWVGLQVLRPDGILAAFSCSGLLSTDLFGKILFAAATDAERDVQVVARLSQPPDHPVRAAFPEGAYLKGVIARALPER